MTQKKLLLIGPLPEPKGGVSIHITRLSQLLSDTFIIKYIDESPIRKDNVFNLRSKNIFTYFQLLIWADIVHIHSGMTFLRAINLLSSRILRKKTILTYHSFAQTQASQIWINRYLARLSDRTIPVSREIATRLKIDESKVIPAFIPPQITNEPELPEIVTDWLKQQKQNNNIILAGNAFRLTTHNGNDLYGLDMCIEVLKDLTQNHNIEASMIFVVASLLKTEDRYHKYQQLIKEYNLSDNFVLTHQDLSFSRLIDNVDIILRPTSTDGDAMTIREALFLGKPIIASDVVNRPEGTILFKNRDHSNFLDAVITTINKLRTSSVRTSKQPAFKGIYTRIYLD